MIFPGCLTVRSVFVTFRVGVLSVLINAQIIQLLKSFNMFRLIYLFVDSNFSAL